MRLSFLLEQYPACFVCLIWMILEVGDKWPYSWCFLGCCFQDLFSRAHSIFTLSPSSFSSIRLVRIHVVHPYNRSDMTAARGKNCIIILSDKSAFHMINNLSIAIHAFTSHILMPLSVDKMLYVNLSWNSIFWLWCIPLSTFLLLLL